MKTLALAVAMFVGTVGFAQTTSNSQEAPAKMETKKSCTPKAGASCCSKAMSKSCSPKKGETAAQKPSATTRDEKAIESTPTSKG